MIEVVPGLTFCSPVSIPDRRRKLSRHTSLPKKKRVMASWERQAGGGDVPRSQEESGGVDRYLQCGEATSLRCRPALTVSPFTLEFHHGPVKGSGGQRRFRWCVTPVTGSGMCLVGEGVCVCVCLYVCPCVSVSESSKIL